MVGEGGGEGGVKVEQLMTWNFIQTLRQRGGGSLQNFVFGPLVPQSGLNIRGEPRPPGPFPRSATTTFTPHKDHKVINFCFSERNMNGWGGGRGGGGKGRTVNDMELRWGILTFSAGHSPSS